MAPLPPGLYLVIPNAPLKGGLAGEISNRDSLPGLFLNQKVTLREGEPTHSAEIPAVPHVSIEIQWLDSTGKPCAGNSAGCEGNFSNPKKAISMIAGGKASAIGPDHGPIAAAR